jgi:hypothetical protein
MQTAAESERYLHHAFVAIDLNHIACAIYNSSAALAPAQVFLDGGSQLWRDLAVEVI